MAIRPIDLSISGGAGTVESVNGGLNINITGTKDF